MGLITNNILRLTRHIILLVTIFACLAFPVLATSSDAAFITQLTAAIKKMMSGMSVRPSGNVDKDFVDAMVPHHEGAIEMAEAELRYGNNLQVQRIAQEIIVTQQEEIAAMRLAVGESLPPSAPAPDQTPKERQH
jgi:Domain of unknown function (DUF305)